MPASDWAQKNLCIIVPNQRRASPEFFSCVRTRPLLSRHTCLARSPKKCTQSGNFQLQNILVHLKILSSRKLTHGNACEGILKLELSRRIQFKLFIDQAFYLRYLRYLAIGQKQNFLGANGNSHPKCFSESSIVPSFLFREAESEIFPCEYTRTALVNEPDKHGEIIAVVYEHMKRTQEMLFADWAQ